MRFLGPGGVVPVDVPVECRVIYTVTRADGTVEQTVAGEWEATTVSAPLPGVPLPAHLKSPRLRNPFRRLLSHINKKVV